MSTLQELRKTKFSTIKSFAIAWGCSASKTSNILKGKHHLVLSREEVQKLADLFGASFDDVVNAADNTFAEYKGWIPLPSYWKLQVRWGRRDKIFQDMFDTIKNNGPKKPRFPYSPLFDDTFEPLGLTPPATEDEIKTAFRNKVKALADGQGGYNGDMDKLVQAKEKALAYVKGQR